METPIVDFVKKYAHNDALRLHMPGHKGSLFFGCEKFDITEIDGADVLYSAEGIIADSQKNATKLFNTKATFYSTEGSSLCVRAMLYLIKSYAIQNKKRPLIAAGRNAHKTFITAAALLNVDVDWLLPDDVQSIISCVITSEALEKYLQNAEEKPVAVYITSPDYLGNITDVEAIGKICHKYGVLFVVDNAHGAYLKFLPTDIHPISIGADMCCDSAHKTLPVLTGGAYFHVAKTAPSFFSINAQKALSIFASTSPSYLILQSLDMANQYIENGYCEELLLFADKIKKLKETLIKNGYTLCGDETLKITLSTKSYGYTGYELSEILLNKNVICEFADPDYVVLMLAPQISDKEIEKLQNALCEIKAKKPIDKKAPIPKLKEAKISIHTALYAESEIAEAESCFGRISASINVACPPAIPIVLPGEIIDADTIRCFEYYNITKWEIIK